jgi:hypothetical protein
MLDFENCSDNVVLPQYFGPTTATALKVLRYSFKVFSRILFLYISSSPSIIIAWLKNKTMKN